MLLLDSLEVLYTMTFFIKQNGWNKTYYEAIVPTMEFSNLARLTFDKRPFMKLDGLLLLISLPIPLHTLHHPTFHERAVYQAETRPDSIIPTGPHGSMSEDKS